VGEPLKRNVRCFQSCNVVATSAEIIYRDFWDVPRIFVASFRGRQYLFDCRFDESIEDYANVYQVYVMPNLDQKDLKGPWDKLSEMAKEHLGEVPVSSVQFDESKRRAIDPEIIEEVASKND